MKKVKKIQLKIVIFTAVKNRFMLHGRVIVMDAAQTALMALLNLSHLCKERKMPKKEENENSYPPAYMLTTMNILGKLCTP